MSNEVRTPGETRVSDEVEILMGLITARYGGRLTPEQLDGVREGVRGVVEAAVALRKVKLANSDEPCPPFSPVRAAE